LIANVKIVVVDEDKLVRDFTVDVLEFCVNREVFSFDSGSKAWEYIDTGQNPHIVISDVDVPDMNGFDLLKNLKAKYPEKICIIMSHRYQNEKVAKELGADAFLAKPFYIDEIFELVQRYVVDA
jgi:DNA-binding NtrC family response regulator